MANEIFKLPETLALLNRRLSMPNLAPADVLLPLRAIQRMGLSAADIRVYLERARAANDVTSRDETLEQNALLALDLVSGLIPDHGLSWSPADTAQTFLPRVIDQQMLETAVRPAFTPSTILPPRPGSILTEGDVRSLSSRLYDQISTFNGRPQAADVYRSPKTGFTSRPAALLAPQDRVLYEALAEPMNSSLDRRLPNQVIWPRSRLEQPSYGNFTHAPSEWVGKYVLSADIESFYENVDHAILANTIGGYFDGSPSYLTAIESHLDAVMNLTIGLPQGPPASELFATAYLLPIDFYIRDQGWQYVRYADDLLVSVDSVVDGRRRIENLEEVLRHLNLRLNASKTRIFRRSTYIRNTDGPSRRVQNLRREIRSLLEDELLHSDDSERVEEILRGAGAEEEMLWNLLYHRTTTIEEVIEELRDRLEPPLLDAYASYFTRVAARFSAGAIPKDLDSSERDLRECLAFMATGGRFVDLSSADIVLRWMPRLAPDVSQYLTALSGERSKEVATFVEAALTKLDDIDWVTAWLCNVVEGSPGIVTRSLNAVLRSVARNDTVGQLTRTCALRALANSGGLDSNTWDIVYASCSNAMRAELILARGALPDRYPRVTSPDSGRLAIDDSPGNSHQ